MCRKKLNKNIVKKPLIGKKQTLQIVLIYIGETLREHTFLNALAPMQTHDLCLKICTICSLVQFVGICSTLSLEFSAKFRKVPVGIWSTTLTNTIVKDIHHNLL